MTEHIKYWEIRKLVADRLEPELKPLIDKYAALWEAADRGDRDSHPNHPSRTEFRVLMIAVDVLERLTGDLRKLTLEERVEILETAR